MYLIAFCSSVSLKSSAVSYVFFYIGTPYSIKYTSNKRIQFFRSYFIFRAFLDLLLASNPFLPGSGLCFRIGPVLFSSFTILISFNRYLIFYLFSCKAVNFTIFHARYCVKYISNHRSPEFYINIYRCLAGLCLDLKYNGSEV